MMHLGIGIQEGKIFPIMPNLSKKIFHATFPKLLLMGGGGGGVVLYIFIISQYCPTVKQILPDWLSLPNNLGAAMHFGTLCLYAT